MNIFYKSSLLLATLFLVACNTSDSKKGDGLSNTNDGNVKEIAALTDQEFLINGHSFSDDLKTVYLHKLDNKVPVIIDSVTVSNKQFKFKGTIPNPDYYSLSSNLSNKRFKLLVDASVIDVFLNETTENSSSYSSTPIQKEYATYAKKMYGFRNKGVDLYYNLKGDFSSANISKLKKDRSKLFTESGQYTAEHITANPQTYFSALLIRDNIETYDKTKMRGFYNNLTPELKNLAFVKAIDAVLIEKETVISKPTPAKTTTTVVAKTAPSGEYRPKAYSVKGKNQYGETMSLNSIPRGKVVLLDFWASWCGPCRATNPDLVQLYNKYNEDGLEIMSVSMDKGIPEWMNAINTDNLTWQYHVLDKNKTIAFRYGVESIPYKILIDKKGNIASDKISGRKLEARIKQLLAE